MIVNDHFIIRVGKCNDSFTSCNESQQWSVTIGECAAVKNVKSAATPAALQGRQSPFVISPPPHLNTFSMLCGTQLKVASGV